MQNDKPNRIWQFLRKRGNMLLLILCVAAVAVSGFVFVRTALNSGASELLEEDITLSVPVKPEPKPQEQTKEPAKLDLTPESEDEPSAQLEDEPVVETSRALVVRPVAGDTFRSYSMDHLTYSRTMRDWRTHDGIDIAADLGAPVRAAMDGTVSAVYDDDFLGTVVELAHPDGTRTVYANLTQMPTVDVGDYVTAGSVIGAVGNTALGESAEGTHLHFAVYRNDLLTDPEQFLP